MKTLKLTLFALTLLPFAMPTTASAHRTENNAHLALAMEPASWVFVAFGLAGGGFLRKRRLRGLNLTSLDQTSATPSPAETTLP